MKRFTAFLAPLALAALLAMPAADTAAAGERDKHPQTAAGLAAIDKGDYEVAFRHFNNRAAKGDAEAQFELGMLYALGKGVERDFVAAYMWTEIAARAREPYADFIREEVAANMTPAQIDQAIRLANAWMRDNGR